MNQLCFETDEHGNLALSRNDLIEKADMSVKYQEMLSRLDEFQRVIVEAPENSSMCCIAGAGAGKTFTIISRAIKLVHIDSVDPTEIVLITFTNKAANELKERYLNFFKDQYAEGEPFPTPHMSTIHSFCLSQLRRTFGFKRTILTEYQSFKLFREICKDVYLKEEGRPIDIQLVNALYKRYQALQSSLEIFLIAVPIFDEDGKFLRIVPSIKEAAPYSLELLRNMPFFKLLPLLTGEAQTYTQDILREIMRVYTLGLRQEVYTKILHRYLTEKYSSNSLDFTDMDFQYLLAMLRPELREYVHNRYKHIIIDEAQDVSPAQYLTCIFSDKESFEHFCNKAK